MKIRILHPIAIFASILLWACSNNYKRDEKARIIEEWIGKEIIFPEVMTDVLTGDTVDISDADFTILTYVDSTGCTGCNMKLPLWSKFIESLDSIATDYEVLPLFIVNANNENDLSHVIRRNKYEFPVINDTIDSINLINHFSEESTYRTLLLNNKRQVIAIGNPVINNLVADLYSSIISGSKHSAHRAVRLLKSHHLPNTLEK